MLDPQSVLDGIGINEIARRCGVDLTTARRWKRRAICPPQWALALLSGAIEFLDPAWRGWVVRRGLLVSPEGWEISMHDVLAQKLMAAQIAAYQSENRALKSLVTELEKGGYEDQPTPDSWDVQILTG